MTTDPYTKLLKRETLEQLDGTQRVLSYFEPTDETMQTLVQDLLQGKDVTESMEKADEPNSPSHPRRT